MKDVSNAILLAVFVVTCLFSSPAFAEDKAKTIDELNKTGDEIALTLVRDRATSKDVGQKQNGKADKDGYTVALVRIKK